MISNAGVRASLDDFGTGHGSFRHLQEFKFDIRIVAGIAIARGLGIANVAEGIKTEGQGILFGRPKPSGELKFLLEKNRPPGRMATL